MKDNKTIKIIIISILALACVLLIAGIVMLLMNNKSYKVTFMNENVVVSEIQVKAGEKITRPTTPNKSGYEFTGWALNGQVIDLDNYKLTSNITLTAAYKELPVNENTEYIVSFYTGDLYYQITDQVVKPNELATEPDLSMITWVEITGWYLEDGTKFDFNTPVTRNLKLYVHYKKDDFEYSGYDTSEPEPSENEIGEDGNLGAPEE